MLGDGAFGLQFVGFALECLALVADVLAAAEAELDFHSSAAEVSAQRDEGEPLGLGGLGQALHFALVYQELAITPWRVVVAVAVVVGRDVRPDEPELPLFHAGVCLHEGESTGATRLHLGAAQGDARLDLLEDVEVVAGFAVVRNGAHGGGMGGRLGRNGGRCSVSGVRCRPPRLVSTTLAGRPTPTTAFFGRVRPSYAASPGSFLASDEAVHDSAEAGIRDSRAAPRSARSRLHVAGGVGFP